ncbi:hypothetical protein QE152_g24456 [Popillia japonica]|uniref:IPT/TIG domain-containing protein n=1 Tax=Popillia japonica TaxID=7064 RepID=A0AAW1KB89_POPJA
MGAPMFSGHPITINGLGNVGTRTLGKFTARVNIECQQFSTGVHVVSDKAIPMKVSVGKPVLDQVTVTISSEGIPVTAPTILKHKNTDREQKEGNIDVLIRTFRVLVANIDDEFLCKRDLRKGILRKRNPRKRHFLEEKKSEDEKPEDEKLEEEKLDSEKPEEENLEQEKR